MSNNNFAYNTNTVLFVGCERLSMRRYCSFLRAVYEELRSMAEHFPDL